MSNLVRVRVGDVEFNVGSAHAEANNLDVIDESPYRPDGTTLPATRAGGRPRKPKVSVAEAADKKAAKSADDGLDALNSR